MITKDSICRVTEWGSPPIHSFLSSAFQPSPKAVSDKRRWFAGKPTNQMRQRRLQRRGLFLRFPRISDRSTPAKDSLLRQALAIAAIPFSSLCWVQKSAKKFVSAPPPKVKSGLGKRRFANPFLIVSVFFAEVFCLSPPVIFPRDFRIVAPGERGEEKRGRGKGEKNLLLLFPSLLTSIERRRLLSSVTEQ